MSSFAENKAKKLIAKDLAAFVDYNTRQLSRIYPAGKRADSSNFNPVQFWNAGCQIGNKIAIMKINYNIITLYSN